MSDNRSWRKSSRSFHDDAIVLVRKAVGILRSGGENTESALGKLGPTLKSTTRRMRTLFYEDGTPIVLGEEWTRLRHNAAAFFLEREAHHYAMAAKCRAEAEELQRAEQLEFSWDRPEWRHGNDLLRGRTAAGGR